MIINHSLIIINQRHQAHRRGRRHATSVTLSTSSPQQIFERYQYLNPRYHDRHNHYLLLAIGLWATTRGPMLRQ